jgi:hypothetical protein
MPPLLCPSPVLLDQTFPRSLTQARAVNVALSKFLELLKEESALHLMTESLQERLKLWYDGKIDPGHLEIGSELSEKEVKQLSQQCRAIFVSLANLVTSRQNDRYWIDTDEVEEELIHPIVWDYAGMYVEKWRRELGRVAILHARVATEYRPFAAVACLESFGGNRGFARSSMDLDPAIYQLPIVDPDGVGELGNAFSYKATEVDQSPIPASAARAQLPKVGLRMDVTPSGAWKIYHRQHRTREILLNIRGNELEWPDVERIASLTDDVPAAAVHFLLKHGHLPEKELRLPLRKSLRSPSKRKGHTTE